MERLNDYEVVMHEPLVLQQFLKDPSNETLQAVDQYTKDTREFN